MDKGHLVVKEPISYEHRSEKFTLPAGTFPYQISRLTDIWVITVEEASKSVKASTRQIEDWVKDGLVVIKD